MESGLTSCHASRYEWVGLAQLVVRALVGKPLTQVGFFASCMLLWFAVLS